MATDIQSALDDLGKQLDDVEVDVSSAEAESAAAAAEEDVIKAGQADLERAQARLGDILVRLGNQEQTAYRYAGAYVAGVEAVADDVADAAALGSARVDAIAAGLKTGLGLSDVELGNLVALVEAYDTQTQALRDAAAASLEAAETAYQAAVGASVRAKAAVDSVAASIAGLDDRAAGLGSSTRVLLVSAEQELSEESFHRAVIGYADALAARTALTDPVDLAAPSYDVSDSAGAQAAIELAWDSARAAYELALANELALLMDLVAARVAAARDRGEADTRDATRTGELETELLAAAPLPSP